MSVTIKERLPPFSPLSISGCQLWMDASDSSSNSMNLSGSTVTQWKDKSGNGNNTTAYSGTPALTSSAINGSSAISMAGGYFTGPFATANTGTQVHAFAVLSIDSSSGVWPRPLSLGRPGAHDFNDPTTTFAIIRYSGGQAVGIGRNGQYLSVGFPTYSTPFLVQSSHNGETEFMSVNGNLTVSSLNTGQTGNFNITSYGLGVNTNTSDYFVWNGYYGEVIYYNVQLSVENRQKVEGYLAWKWGLQAQLPAGHPYATAIPQGSITEFNVTFPLKLKSSNVFVPPQISGCQLWLDAADPAGYSVSGGTVTQLKDKSGNGYNSTSGAGTVSYAAAGLNGLPSFSLNATGGFRGPTSITGTTLTAFTVATINIGVNYNGRLFGLATPSANDYQNITTCQPFFAYNGGPGVGAYRNNTYLSQVNPGFDTPFIGTSVFTGASNIMYLNGVSGTSFITSGTFSISQYGFGCEGQSNTGVNWYGYISEIILYNSALTTQQQQQVEGYLAWKWGLQSNLPTTHPYYAKPIAPFSYQYSSLQRTSIMRFASPLLSQGCALWLDARDTTSMTLANGNQLSQWNDKSGNGRHMTRQGSAASVTLQMSNNLRFVKFDNATANNVYMNTTKFTQLPVMSMFMVFTPQTTSSTWSFFWSWRALAASNYLPGLRLQNSGTQLQPYTTYSGSGASVATIVAGQTYLVYMDFSNGATNAVNLALNGTTSFVAGTLGAFNTFQNEFTLGADVGGTYGAMNLNELVFFNNILPTAQRQQMEGYLAWKWGLQGSLPTSHPFSLYPPTADKSYSNYLINYAGFPTSSGLSLVSAFPSVTNNELQVNGNTGSVASAVWFSTLVNIQTFTTSFVLRFDSTAADGATFCIQNVGLGNVGANGGALGYQNLGTSVAVTFKTYNSANGIFSVDYLTNGATPPSLGASGVLNTALNLTSGQTWFFYVLITYNGTTLNWTVRNLFSTSLSYSSNATLNIPATVGSSNTAYVGFTSGTGGATEACTVSSWLYNN